MIKNKTKISILYFFKDSTFAKLFLDSMISDYIISVWYVER